MNCFQNLQGSELSDDNISIKQVHLTSVIGLNKTRETQLHHWLKNNPIQFFSFLNLFESDF